MIKNAEEARAAVKVFDCGCAGTHHPVCNRITDDKKYSQAQGYLAALNGPEVKALLERLVTLASALPPNAISMHLGKALAQYFAAAKGE